MRAYCGMLKDILPKVTVVIVNWNGSEFLERCLVAVTEQTVSPHKIILVDNASSDSSLDIVRRFPSVCLLAQHKNLGFARANNLAIDNESIDSEWLALMNPDAFATRDWLRSMFFGFKSLG